MSFHSPASAAIDLYADALLFDSDGVLVDSREAVAAAWTEWAERFSLDPKTVVTHVHGRTAHQTVAHFLTSSLWNEGIEVIDRLERESAERVQAMPGALAVISELDHSRWAVVTSGTTEIAHARLQAAKIPIPPVVVTARDVREGKPSAAPYLLAAKKLHVSPNHCVVFEDAPAGVAAARAAAVRHIVGVGRAAAVLDVDAYVRDLNQVRIRPGGVRILPAR